MSHEAPQREIVGHFLIAVARHVRRPLRGRGAQLRSPVASSVGRGDAGRRARRHLGLCADPADSLVDAGLCAG